jgi:GNAT superfamily N-acetyltransferase
VERVRPFEPRDADAVAALFAAYMAEVFSQPTVLTPDILLLDGQGRFFRLVLAVDEADRPIGFAAGRPHYDLHHAVAGAEISDLFVSPHCRGRAVAFRLVAGVARAARAQGCAHIKGPVLTDDPKRLRMVRRIAVGFPSEDVYVSGRAFRELADLADADRKTFVRKLPPPESSREP